MACLYLAVYLVLCVVSGVDFNAESFVSQKRSFCKGKKLHSCSNPMNILVVPQYFPVPSQDRRVFHVVEMLKAVGCSVVIAPFSTLVVDKSTNDDALMSALDVMVTDEAILRSENPLQSYRGIIANNQPDVVLMWLSFADPHHNAPGFLSKETRLYLSTVKIWVFADVQYSSQDMLLANALTSGRSRMASRIEQRVFSDADVIVTLTDTDRFAILKSDFKSRTGPSKVFTLPFVASPWYFIDKQAIPSFQERKGLVFIGDANSPTDVLGIEWYIKNIYPGLVAKIPDITLTIIGVRWSWLFNARVKLNKGPRKHIKTVGAVSEEIKAELVDKARVYIAPHQVSTGIVADGVYALARAIPLVTTLPGSQGMCIACDNPLEMEKTINTLPFMVGADKKAYLRHVLAAYQEQRVWNRFSAKGYLHAKSFFGKEKMSVRLNNIITYA